MPPPTDADRDANGVAASSLLASEPKNTGIWCFADLNEVRRNLFSTGYPTDKIRFVQGNVEETIPAEVPEAIAILRLDTDWYESTKHELLHEQIRSAVFIL